MYNIIDNLRFRNISLQPLNKNGFENFFIKFDANF